MKTLQELIEKQEEDKRLAEQQHQLQRQESKPETEFRVVQGYRFLRNRTSAIQRGLDYKVDGRVVAFFVVITTIAIFLGKHLIHLVKRFAGKEQALTIATTALRELIAAMWKNILDRIGG